MSEIALSIISDRIQTLLELESGIKDYDCIMKNLNSFVHKSEIKSRIRELRKLEVKLKSLEKTSQTHLE